MLAVPESVSAVPEPPVLLDDAATDDDDVTTEDEVPAELETVVLEELAPTQPEPKVVLM